MNGAPGILGRDERRANTGVSPLRFAPVEMTGYGAVGREGYGAAGTYWVLGEGRLVAGGFAEVVAVVLTAQEVAGGWVYGY